MSDQVSERVVEERTRASVLSALAVAGERRRIVLAQLVIVKRELDALIRAAADAGVNKRRIAEVGGVAPGTVYAALEEVEPE